MINIFPIPAFNDNYIWIITNESLTGAIVVDPGDSVPVINFLKKNNLKLSAIFITHHHMDHTGGLNRLLSLGEAPVFSDSNSEIKGITNYLNNNDMIDVDGFNLSFELIKTPGHTNDHVVFYERSAGLLFSGDHLFSAGCGRIFEGSFDEMFDSLQKIKELPEKTLIYPAHEYTMENLRFAAAVEPENKEIDKRLKKIIELRDSGKPVLPSTLYDELQTNPFLRCNNKNVRGIAEKRTGSKIESEFGVFKAIREWKNIF